MLNKKGLNRDIDFTAKTKTPYKKAILDKTKTSHQRLLESSESDVFWFINFWLLKGVFGFGGIWFISWRIDYFNFAIFFRTYLATSSLKQMKNMNPHKFSIVCIKKIIRIEEILFLKKLLKKIWQISQQFFLHGNGWLNTFFHQLVKIPELKKKMEYSIAYFNPFAFSNIYVSDFF